VIHCAVLNQQTALKKAGLASPAAVVSSLRYARQKTPPGTAAQSKRAPIKTPAITTNPNQTDDYQPAVSFPIALLHSD
jgi:hypothetical protein